MNVSLDPIDYLQQEVAQTRHLLLNNEVYQRLQTLFDLRRFMEHHVFAVWDFMPAGNHSVPRIPHGALERHHAGQNPPLGGVTKPTTTHRLPFEAGCQCGRPSFSTGHEHHFYS